VCLCRHTAKWRPFVWDLPHAVHLTAHLARKVIKECLWNLGERNCKPGTVETDRENITLLIIKKSSPIRRFPILKHHILAFPSAATATATATATRQICVYIPNILCSSAFKIFLLSAKEAKRARARISTPYYIFSAGRQSTGKCL